MHLASSNPESRTLVGDQCDISADWEAVAGNRELDGVIIATPPALHVKMARTVVAAGIPVLVEKPLALDAREARELLDFAIEQDAIVHVDHIHLYNPAWRALKNIGLGMGPIHALRGGAGDWGPFRASTPMLWDRGSHEISMCLDLMGTKPESATARLKETRETDEGMGEDIALQLTFPGGVNAHIEISNILAAKKRFFAVHYDHETMIFDDVGKDALVREPRPDDAKCLPEKATAINVPDVLPLDMALFEFAAAIEKGEADIQGLRLGVDVVEVLDACQLSLRP